MFNSTLQESHIDNILVTDVPYHTFVSIIRFIYTDTIDLPNLAFDEVKHRPHHWSLRPAALLGPVSFFSRIPHPEPTAKGSAAPIPNIGSRGPVLFFFLFPGF